MNIALGKSREPENNNCRKEACQMDNKFQELAEIMNRYSVERSQHIDPFQNKSIDITARLLSYQSRTAAESEDSCIAEDDCPNIELCRQMQIAQENICTKGSDTRLMCSFGESRIVMLLARLCSKED
jgi:hypothetical protein